jgi:hypothetical protein
VRLEIDPDKSHSQQLAMRGGFARPSSEKRTDDDVGNGSFSKKPSFRSGTSYMPPAQQFGQ